MKKHLLTIPLLCLTFAISAQTNYKNLTDYKSFQKQAEVKIPESGNNDIKDRLVNENPVNFVTRADETIVGTTKYDLQTNNSMPRRIVNYGDGTIGATYTFSSVTNFSTRGTGYVYFNGSTWSTPPAAGADQVETTRSGWPSLAKLGSGGEIVLSHGNAADALIYNKRATKGTGSWSQTTFTSNVIPYDTMKLWPRMTTGGLDGNTIHIIARTESSLTAGMGDPIYFGMQGALVYTRSTNGGLTWDKVNDIIPGLDATNFIGISGDTYAIDAKGNTVAVVVGGLAEGVALYKSTDNGTTWTMTWVMEPRIKKFDEAVHVISSDDPMPSSDGTVGLIIDNDDVVHVFYGYQEISNETTGDGLLSYFPTMNSIEYWNENMGKTSPVSIAGAPDVNGNGFLDVSDDGSAYVTGNYRFEGLASQPQGGIDANGCLYIVYSAIHEELTEFGSDTRANLRHIWGIKSCDGGCTWTEPVDLTPSLDIPFSECVYPSIARLVDNYVHFIYQRDFYTSTSLTDTDNHPVEDNDIIYVKAAVSEFDNSVGVCLVYLDEYTADEPLCPGESIVLAANCGLQYQWNDGSTTESIEVVTAGIYELTVTTECGDSTLVINLNDLIVFENSTVTLSATDANCTAEDGTVSTSIDGVSNPYTYLWSNGATTNNLTDLDFGQYIVTITDINNCTFIDTADVDLIDLLDGDISATTVTSACGASDGAIDYNILSGTPPYSFLWNNGETTSSLTGIPAGSYSISIIDDKGCEDYFTIDIIDNGAPTVSFINVMDVSCFGGNDGSAEATATGTGTSYTYTWLFDNSVNETATGLSIGTYKVQVVDNDGCKAFGDVIISQPTLLTLSVSTINETCTYANGTASASVNGGVTPYTYNWSNGATSSSISNLSAGTYSITVADNNACSNTSSFTITDSPSPIVNITVSDAYCGNANGQASALVSGGTSPLSYLWSNGAVTETATNLIPNTYSVTVTDNNACFDVQSVVVGNVVYSLAISATVENEICNNAQGQITTSTTGSSTPYSYNWSNGNVTPSISGLSAGTYNLTVSDTNGCSEQESFAVSNNNITISVSTSVTDAICLSSTGSVSLNPTNGTAPYSYNWSNGASSQDITNVAAGTYTVTVTDFNGCTSVTSAFVNEPTALDVDYTTTPEFCDLSNGEITLTITDGTSPYTISWADGSTSDMLTGLVGGDYDVTVMDANDCSVELSINVVAFSTPNVDVDVTPASCGGSDGDALITSITGDSPFEYVWENGATTDFIDNLSAGVYNFTLTDANGCVLESYATISTNVVPNITVTSTDALCFGDATGSIGSMASGTTATYTFDWFTLSVVESGVTTSGATGISAGSYPVQVTDENDCIVFGTAVVDEPTQLVASISGTVDATCNGDADGEAMVTATGGTGAYSFEWADNQTDDNAISLTAGDYDVTITDDNGCTSSATAIVAQPNVLVASVSSNNISCNGLTDGDATASAVGGNGGYDFTWSNTETTDMISSLAAGTFSVTVEDMMGCTASASGTVTEPTILSVNVTNGGTVCALATTSITATPAGGTAGYTYNWNVAGATASITGGLGTYNVTVTDSEGCTATGSTTVTLSAIGANVTLTAVVDNNATDNNGQATATATGGTGVYVYTWSNTQVGPTATGLAPNDYTVTAADAVDCVSNTVTVTIGVSSLNELTQTSSYSVYPNPNNGIFNVKLNNVEQGVYTVEVRNLLGQIISSNQVTTSGNAIVEVTLNDVNAGVYFLNVRGNYLDNTERIIIK
jgi:hypothetical protein